MRVCVCTNRTDFDMSDLKKIEESDIMSIFKYAFMTDSYSIHISMGEEAKKTERRNARISSKS